MTSEKRIKKPIWILIGTVLVWVLLSHSVFAADNNSEGGLVLEDYMDSLAIMDTASAGLGIDTITSAATFEGDTSTLKRTAGTPYAIYKRNDIKSFVMVAYFDPNRNDQDFKFYASQDGILFNPITPSVYQEGALGSSWNRVVYSDYQLSNVNYLKVEWGSSSSTAQISKIRIAYTGGLSFSDTGFEHTATTELATVSGWEAKYAKIVATDSLDFAVSIESAGGAPGEYLKVIENNPTTSSGAVLLGQRVTLPSFFESPDDIIAGIDFKAFSAASNRSNVIRLVVMTESSWNSLSNTNAGATLYNSNNELYQHVLHNGFVATDDVTEWTQATTDGHDLTASLGAYLDQTLVFAIKLEARYPNSEDWFELDNVELNMGELSNSRPHFVNMKELRDKYFGYRWSQSLIADLKAKSDMWLNRTIELIPNSDVVTSSNRFVCPAEDSALIYEYKSYSDILATGETYDTYFQAAEFICRGADQTDPNDDYIVSYATNPDKMEAITTGWYSYWFRDHAWAAYNLSTIFAATGELAYAQKAAEIVNEFASKYPEYELHDVVDPIRPLAARTYYNSFAESADFVLPLVFAVDHIYNSGYISNSEKKAIRDDMLYPARDVQKRVAEVYNHQVVHDAAIALIGYLYDDETIINEGKHGFEATAETETAMGMFNELLDYGVGEDGIWFEGTLGYHGLVLKFYDYVAEAAKRNGSTNNENLYSGNSKLEAMHNAVLKMLYPDLTIQANNDGGYNPSILSGVYLWMMETADKEYNGINQSYRQFLNEAYRIVPRDATDIKSFLYGYQEIPFTPEPLASIDNNLSALGTVITRDYSDADNKLMTTLDYGAVAGTHDHYDKLSITTFGNGRLWLDDLGRTAYGTVSATEYHPNTVAHNTVSVRDSTQAALGGRFVGMGHTQSMHISSASADAMFPNVEEYNRTLLMIKPFIIDIFKLKSNQSVTFDWLAHVVDSSLSVSDVTMTPASGSLGTNKGYQHVDHLFTGNTNTSWSATFTDTKLPSSDYSYKIRMLNEDNMDVHITEGFGKAHEPTNKIPKLVASRTVTGETEFIAMHEFIEGNSQVSGFEQIGDIIKVTMLDGTQYYLQYNLDYALEEASFKLLTLDNSQHVTSIELSNDNRFVMDETTYIKSSNVLSNLSITAASSTVTISHDQLDTTQKMETELTFYVGDTSVTTVALDGTSISFTRNGDYITVVAPLRSVPSSRNQSIVLSPSEDTYARQPEPDRVMGEYTTIVASNANKDQVSYIKFDLNGYSGNDITEASLKVYAFNKSIADGGPAILSVYGITDDSWDEDTLTWNNTPQITTTGGDTVLTGTNVYVGSITMLNHNQQWHELDVTSFIKNHAFSDKQASFIIYNPNNTIADWIFMTSKEGGARAPKLELKESKDIAATQAAHITGGTNSTANYGSSSVLNVRNGSSASDDSMAYMQFNLNTYDHDRLGKGILNFYVSGTSNPSSSVALSVYGIMNDSWNESTLTWDLSPNHEPSDSVMTGVGVSAFKIGTLYVDQVDKYYKIDATEFLNSRLATGLASFVIVDEKGSQITVTIHSDESSHKPLLELYKPTEVNVTVGDFIRGGSYADDNYATSNHLIVRSYPTDTTFIRKSYVQIDLSDVNTSKVNKGVIRLRGYNTTPSSTVTVSVYGILDDTWTETGLTWNSAPNHNTSTGAVTDVGISAFLLDEVNVDNTVMYYEFDISDFIYSQLISDRRGSLVFTILDQNSNSYIDFNSDETSKPPVFVLEY